MMGEREQAAAHLLREDVVWAKVAHATNSPVPGTPGLPLLSFYQFRCEDIQPVLLDISPL